MVSLARHFHGPTFRTSITSAFPIFNCPAACTCCASGVIGAKPRFHPPFLDLAHHHRIDGDRIFAGENRRMMHRVIGMRLRAPGILRDQAVHDVEHDLLADERDA